MGEKVVIDTNVIISAFGWAGNEHLLMKKCLDKEYEWYITKEQLGEIERVLDYKKFDFSYQDKKAILKIIRDTSIEVVPKRHVNVLRDHIDNNLIECALEAKAEYIITGDKALLRLKDFQDIKIVTARELINK